MKKDRFPKTIFVKVIPDDEKAYLVADENIENLLEPVGEPAIAIGEYQFIGAHKYATIPVKGAKVK